jgi:hypothetical protein
MTASRRTYALMFLIAAILASGCGQKHVETDSVYPAQGKLTIHGEPASYVMVHLMPVDLGKGAEATGVTEEDGSFMLRTYSNTDFDGAVPGEYTVSLEPYNGVESVGVKVPPGAKYTPIPPEGLTVAEKVEIKAEDNNLEINVP